MKILPCFFAGRAEENEGQKNHSKFTRNSLQYSHQYSHQNSTIYSQNIWCYLSTNCFVQNLHSPVWYYRHTCGSEHLLFKCTLSHPFGLISAPHRAVWYTSDPSRACIINWGWPGHVANGCFAGASLQMDASPGPCSKLMLAGAFLHFDACRSSFAH